MSEQASAVQILDPEVVGQAIVKVEQTTGIIPSEAEVLKSEFRPFYNEIAAICETAATITDPTDKAQRKLAKSTRLALKSVRCNIESLRKRLKEDSLKRGKAIDGYANVMRYAIEPVEERMEAIEKHVEREEERQVALLVAERTAALAAVECDPSAYNLAVMDEATFDALLAGAKKQHAAKREAAARVEAERVAREQADRIAREKAEAEAAEARRAAAEIEAKARKEREDAEAALAAERAARERAERQAADAKRKEQERIRREQEAKAEQERIEREAKEAALKAPERDKLKEFAATLRALDVPAMDSESGRKAATAIRTQIDKFSNWVEDLSKRL